MSKDTKQTREKITTDSGNLPLFISLICKRRLCTHARAHTNTNTNTNTHTQTYTHIQTRNKHTQIHMVTNTQRPKQMHSIQTVLTFIHYSLFSDFVTLQPYFNS